MKRRCAVCDIEGSESPIIATNWICIGCASEGWDFGLEEDYFVKFKTNSCPSCESTNYPQWNEEGECITCARDRVLRDTDRLYCFCGKRITKSLLAHVRDEHRRVAYLWEASST